jgi:hypothetical protein
VQVKVSFGVSGYVVQTVEILKKDMTAEQLYKGLCRGELITTIHGESSFIETLSGEKVAQIEAVDNQVEYTDFDVEVV